MSVLTEALRERGVFNPHLAASRARKFGGVGVYVDFRAEERGRAYRSAAYQVIDPDRKTNPGGHWMDNGWQTFTTYGITKPEAKDAAVRWAAEFCGVPADQWVPGPFRGTLVPKSDLTIIKQFAKESA